MSNYPNYQTQLMFLKVSSTTERAWVCFMSLPVSSIKDMKTSKANRLHLRNYLQTSPDYRHKDKCFRLVMSLACPESETNSSRRAYTDKSTDGLYQIYHLPAWWSIIKGSLTYEAGELSDRLTYLLHVQNPKHQQLHLSPIPDTSDNLH